MKLKILCEGSPINLYRVTMVEGPVGDMGWVDLDS